MQPNLCRAYEPFSKVGELCALLYSGVSRFRGLIGPALGAIGAAV